MPAETYFNYDPPRSRREPSARREEETRGRCSACGRRTDAAANLLGTVYCPECRQVYIRNCYDCGCELNSQLDSLHSTNGQVVCSPCYSDRTLFCEACGDQMQAGDLCHTPNGNQYCRSCYNEHCRRCSMCDCLCWLDEMSNRNRCDCDYDEDCDCEPDLICQTCNRLGEWDDRGFFIERPTYAEIRSSRKFGVEFETSDCPDHTSIKNDTVFGCKPDGSVDGMEFVSPVLYADEGLAEVRKLCEQARSLNWQVDSACGFHLHCDMSDESDENCFRVALAYHHTYDFWTAFVSNARKRNYYCAKHIYTQGDFVGYSRFIDWVDGVIAGERYTWVNWTSYRRHKTVELRHHSATLNATKVCNWIKAHTRFIDKAVTLSKAEITRALSGRSVYDQFNTIASWWDDEELSEFYKERAAQFRHPIRRELSLV